MGCGVAHEFRNAAGERYGAFLEIANGTFLELFSEQGEPNEGGFFRHFCIEVEDIERMAARCRSHGHDCDVNRGRTDRILQFWILDPDGTKIEFQQHDHESALYGYIPENRQVLDGDESQRDPI